MWQSRFYKSLPKIFEENAKARWVFVTLTVRNCSIEDLGDTLTLMNTAFQRLKDRKEFKPVLGWVRTTEVTRGADGSAHPHFHTLMIVPSYWFTTAYVKHARWVELWGECLRVNYEPNVDIRTVKSRNEGLLLTDELQSAVAETLKYAIKPADMIADPVWFLEMTRQTFKRRFVATGGVLKDVLRIEEESNKDLVLADGETECDDDGTRLAFDWKEKERRYKRAPKHDTVERK